MNAVAQQVTSRERTAPMRLLFVTPSFYPADAYGGPTELLWGLTRALASAGAQVRVLTSNANGARRIDVPCGEWIRREGVEIFYAPVRLGHDVAPMLAAEAFRQTRWADVVHVSAVYSFAVIPALAAARASGKPVLWAPHGSLQAAGRSNPGLAKSFWLRMCRALAPGRVAFHMTAASEAAESSIAGRRVATFVVPPGIEVPPAVVRTPRPAGKFRVLFLGRLHPIKAIDNLLEACAEMQTPGWSLKVVGDGEPEYVATLRSLASRLGVGERVEFAGAIHGERKSEVFANADVAVLPSHSENFGIAAAEALAHGVPVVASVGTPWSRLDEFGCGRWVSNDPATLARTLDELAAAPLHEMGDRGRRWMGEEFAWSRIADEFLNCARSIVEKA